MAIIEIYGSKYSKELHKNKNAKLREWINFVTPKLQDDFYSLSTKCYWIVNSLVDFPTCPYCKTSGKFIRKNVVLTAGYRKYCSSKCSNSSSETIYKCKKTKCANHGDPNWNNIGQQMNTMIQRYGKAHPLQVNEFLQKQKQTCVKNFGTPFYWQLDAYADECMSKYGVKNISQSSEIKKQVAEKVIQWYVTHYGVRSLFQVPDFFATRRSSYIFDNESYDSKPELAFGIFVKTTNQNISKNSISFFEYEFNQKSYRYFPDFFDSRLNRFIEIKGAHFFRADGTMFCPFRHSSWSDEEYETICEKFEAKRQCMISNNVKIIISPSDEITTAVDFCKNTYGLVWYKQFKAK